MLLAGDYPRAVELDDSTVQYIGKKIEDQTGARSSSLRAATPADRRIAIMLATWSSTRHDYPLNAEKLRGKRKSC